MFAIDSHFSNGNKKQVEEDVHTLRDRYRNMGTCVWEADKLFGHVSPLSGVGRCGFDCVRSEMFAKVDVTQVASFISKIRRCHRSNIPFVCIASKHWMKLYIAARKYW